MNTCVNFFVFSMLVTLATSYPEGRSPEGGNSLAGATALSASDASTGFPYDNNFGLLSGAFASFTVDPSFTGTISAQASLTFHDRFNTHPIGVGGFAYAGGYPRYQSFPTYQPTFQPAFPSYVPPRFSPIFPSGGYSAGASAAIGNGMAHQTAFLNPANPASPNVDIVSRFSESGQGTQGISSFASSSSTNINGKETVHREAGTTVNDNGKITTYHVKD